MYMLMPSPSWLFVVVRDRNILEIEVSMGLFLWITMGWGNYLPEIIKHKLWEVMQYMVDIIYIYISYVYIYIYVLCCIIIYSPMGSDVGLLRWSVTRSRQISLRGLQSLHGGPCSAKKKAAQMVGLVLYYIFFNDVVSMENLKHNIVDFWQITFEPFSKP